MTSAAERPSELAMDEEMAAATSDEKAAVPSPVAGSVMASATAAGEADAAGEGDGVAESSAARVEEAEGVLVGVAGVGALT